MTRKKNMKLGKINLFLILIFLFNLKLIADDKISSVPLVNLEELEPQFMKMVICMEEVNG